jgi:N-carbamoyl-L-amino-acid hydrolase
MAAAYLELHIEQGPVLEHLNLPLAVVVGALGVERHAVSFYGQTAHSGSTPMDMRHDALAAAAKLELALREIAIRRGGVGTMGSLVTRPGIVTAVVGQCDCLIDQRHLEAEQLAHMLREAQEASQRFAQEEGVTVEWKPIYRIAPTNFDPCLMAFGDEALAETGCPLQRMSSGPLHDAVAIARTGIPTGMMFVQSLRGLSHTKEEDTRHADLRLAVQAFDKLALKTADWLRL